MANPQKRPVALLDVDNTLFFEVYSREAKQNIIVYNDNLIDTLIENKVSDVYLFTSMSLKKKTVSERAELVEYLKSKGLKVHGVICAADLVWNKDKGLINEFYKEQSQLTREGAVELLEQEKYRSLRDFNNAIPGQGYATVTAETDNAWTDDDAICYQTVAEIIRKYLYKQDQSRHAEVFVNSEKSYLYRMFVNNKPEWAGDVIFADDADNHIAGVSAMHQQLTPPHRLQTVYNQSKKQNEKDFYQALIEPFVELLNLFNVYASERSYSYSNEKNEILNRFRKELESCPTLEHVDQVREQFKADYQKLKTHRFSFWSEEKTRSATVFDEMYNERMGQIFKSSEKTNSSTVSDEMVNQYLSVI